MIDGESLWNRAGRFDNTHAYFYDFYYSNRLLGARISRFLFLIFKDYAMNRSLAIEFSRVTEVAALAGLFVEI